MRGRRSAESRRREERADSSGPSSTRRSLSANDFARLVRFYLACVEEEDLRSLTLRLTQHHRSFASPWDDSEPLLYPEAPEVTFHVRYEGDRKLLLRGEVQAGEVERFFYGYPCFLDEEDFLTPLFVIEVEVSSNSDGSFTMRPLDPSAPRVNHHLFRRQHAAVEELQAVQDELEGPFGSFAARLRAAFEHLGVEFPALDPDRLSPFPGKGTSRNQWINRPVLFRSERGAFTFHLRRELDALARHQRLHESVMNTALGAILAPAPSRSSRVIDHEVRVLEVLPLNQQQELAAAKSLEAPLTVVTGPPGTGKSQLVVDLLASCALAGRAVLFASKNNKAVDVVRERLRAILGEDRDCTLRLGSRENMERCREEIIARLESLEVTGGGKRQQDRHAYLESFDVRIASLRDTVEQIAEAVEALRAADGRRRAAEALVPEEWVKELDAQPRTWAIDTRRALRAKDEAMALSGRTPLGLLLWVRRLLLGASLRQRLFETLESLTESLPSCVREDLLLPARQDPGYGGLAGAFEQLANIGEWIDSLHNLEAMAAALASMPESRSLAEEMRGVKEEKAKIAAEVLGDGWTERLATARPRIMHLVREYFYLSTAIHSARSARGFLSVLNDLTDTIKALQSYLPIWIVTNLSARRSLPLQPALFDLVIVDEASQCDVASGVPLLFRARRAVVIGDPHQLRHISTLRLDQESNIAQENGAEDLLPEWSYVRRSLYDVAESAVLSAGESPVFLAEHHRSHPDVIEFSNRVFYQSRLVLRTDITALAKRLEGQSLGVFWHDTPGRVPETIRSAWNESEVAAIIDFLGRLCEGELLSRPDVRVGIVTPFRLQMERFEEALRTAPWWEGIRGRVIVGTAHRFQGDECDLVVFSPVVAPGIRDRTARWVAETDQLLNVAITRARGALHIFGDLDACRRAGGYLAQLAEHVTEGQTQGLANDPFDSDAEEQMARILDEVGLWYHPHYPEGRYELDFLVVSPFGTRYDVEVDGLQHWTPGGLAHDAVRDQAIESAGYRVVRVAARDIYQRAELVRSRLARLPASPRLPAG